MQDICTNFSVLNDNWRHVNYTLPLDQLKCDRLLQPGWYKFELNGATAQMPNTNLSSSYRCGTAAPAWYSGKLAHTIQMI